MFFLLFKTESYGKKKTKRSQNCNFQKKNKINTLGYPFGNYRLHLFGGLGNVIPQFIILQTRDIHPSDLL